MGLCLAALALPSLGAILGTADLRGAIVGATVAKPDGAVVFAHNPDVRLMPASNQKLFTVAFALDTLGTNYRSETRFWRDEDSISIDSDGTLDLSYARLEAFAEMFGRRRRVVVSQAYRPGRPTSWQVGDLPNRYAPTIAAFSCDRAGFTLRANAGGNLEIDPPLLGISLSGPGSLSPTFDVVATDRIAHGLYYDTRKGDLYRPPGVSVPPGTVDTLSDPHPDVNAAALFGEGSDPEVVRAVIDPRLVRRRAPDKRLLADPLKDVVGRCLKPSDNFLAEHLLMMGSARRLAGKPTWMPTYDTAAREIAAWARSRVGLPDRSFDPADGSGLSRKNLVTARSVVRLLNWSRKQSWGGVYVNAMATPDTGTLKGRLRGVRFRGKTGTLDGACSLSGLVKCRSGRELAVTLLMNHYSCSTARVRAVQDEFVKRVAASY